MIKPQELFDMQFQNEPVSQPCSASCMHHHSHPCERCGRQWGNVTPLNQRISGLEAELAELKNKDSVKNFDIIQELLKEKNAELARLKYEKLNGIEEVNHGA